MNSLSFKNRVSLSCKSEDIIGIVDELSANYAKREEFASKNHQLFTKKTSEICVPFIACIGVTAVLVVAAAAIYGALVTIGYTTLALYEHCAAWTDNCFGESAMVDSVIYKNIV